MPASLEYFDNRYAGSAFEPLKIELQNVDGSLRNLTGETATFTIRKVKGVRAVVDAAAHTNTPGVAGQFEYQPAAADVSSPGEYTVKIVMQLSGLPKVVVYGLTIDPAP